MPVPRKKVRTCNVITMLPPGWSQATLMSSSNRHGNSFIKLHVPFSTSLLFAITGDVIRQRLVIQRGMVLPPGFRLRRLIIETFRLSGSGISMGMLLICSRRPRAHAVLYVEFARIMALGSSDQISMWNQSSPKCSSNIVVYILQVSL